MGFFFGPAPPWIDDDEYLLCRRDLLERWLDLHLAKKHGFLTPEGEKEYRCASTSLADAMNVLELEKLYGGMISDWDMQQQEALRLLRQLEEQSVDAQEISVVLAAVRAVKGLSLAESRPFDPEGLTYD